MAHSLIVGATETGKTRLAKLIAQKRMESEAFLIPTRQLALDGLGSGWCEGVEVVTEWTEFHKAVIRNHSQGYATACYVDEADMHLSMSDRDHWWALTRGRHFGMDVTVITQRPALVAPTVRGQCATLHCFRVSDSDAQLLAADFAADAMRDMVTKLKQGEWCAVEWEKSTGEKTVNQYVLPDQRRS
jgi:hypothetical protein